MSRTRAKYWGNEALDLAMPSLLEKAEPRLNQLDRAVLGCWTGILAHAIPQRSSHSIARKALLASEQFTECSDSEVYGFAELLRPSLVREGFAAKPTVRALALVGEAIRRSLGFRPRVEQFTAAYFILNGCLVEKATGEGKSVTAVLAAAVAGLAGRQVHVITVNPYLAQRDCDQAAEILSRIGLTHSAIVPDQDPLTRKKCFEAEIIFADSKELSFAYLRALVARQGDRSMLRPNQVPLPNLDFAIVDEADNVLIDEARTPLIIAEPRPIRADQEGGSTWCETALGLASFLEEARDWRSLPNSRAAQLTQSGRDRLENLVNDRELGGLWRVPTARRERVEAALAAIHKYERNIDYLVSEDQEVVIVDESTGRPMPDRAWQAGLHQLIELKEGVEMSDPRVSIAQLTFRQLFSRYRRISGMTGTGREVAGEFCASFGMRFVRLRTHKPVRRCFHGLTLHEDAESKFLAVARQAIHIAQSGGAVLVGTRSVAASEEVARHLWAFNCDPSVLNAKDPSSEAQIISTAGTSGSITVATNMAGRGADIPVNKDVIETGGLHVILTEFHESSRIDRQFIGRTARKGQPGSWSAHVARTDRIFSVPYGRLAQNSSGLLLKCVIWLCQMHLGQAMAKDRQILDMQIKSRMARFGFVGRR